MKDLSDALVVRPGKDDNRWTTSSLSELAAHVVEQHHRATAAGKGTLLVALTGWGQERDRQRTRDAGFDLHLVKPIDPQALTTILSTT